MKRIIVLILVCLILVLGFWKEDELFRYAEGAAQKITDLTALSEAPASGDLLVIVDISDTTMAATGTNKKITFTNFLTNYLAGITATAAEVNILDGVTGVTAAELSYIGDVTSLIQAQIDLKAPLASPTFTGTITIGSAGISEAELEILDGATLTTTQANYLASATGTTGTTSTNLVFSTSPTLVTPTLGAATATSLTLDAAATPGWVFRDSGNPGTDKEIAKFDANFLSGADGAEDGAWYLRAMLAGSEVIALEWNSDNEQLTMGDSGTGEDLIWDFEEATDNEVGVSTNSGTTQINFGTIKRIGTGAIAGAVIVTTADNRALTAAELSGGVVLVTTASEVSLPDVCDSATGANVLIVQRDASEKVEIGVTDTNDDMTLDGTALGANQEIDSPGGAGDAYSYICMVCVSTNMWASFGRRGTWVDGGAAD